MTWGWTALGTFGEMLLAYFLFMAVAFSAGGLAHGTAPDKRQMLVPNLALFTLPGLCVASAGVVIGLDIAGAGAIAYGWYAAPLAAAVVYLAYAVALSRRKR